MKPLASGISLGSLSVCKEMRSKFTEGSTYRINNLLTETTATFIHSDPISTDITATALTVEAKASSAKAARPAAFHEEGHLIPHCN